jgi:pyruvate/2-oxoglutarate dehydrogenase complex dihydrolipoamide acyltransferase (E2) component
MNVSKLFRADVISASFDEAASREAASGRTDTVRAAISAQYGLTLPAKKAGFLTSASEMLAAAGGGDTLGVRSYKDRATLCAVLAITVAELGGEPSSADAELARFTTLFAPKKRATPAATPAAATPAAATPAAATPAAATPAAATPAAAAPAIADAMAVILSALRSGSMPAKHIDALRAAMAEFNATTAAALM